MIRQISRSGVMALGLLHTTAEARGNETRQVRLTGVRTIRALPEYTEIQTSDHGTFMIKIERGRVNILSKELNCRNGRQSPVATFLHFEEPGATILVEERPESCTLVINDVLPLG